MKTPDSFLDFLKQGRPKHRAEHSDLEWAAKQPTGGGHFYIGDIVEFHDGGFGVIKEVSKPQSGWPEQYATSNVQGLAGNPKCAWHYPLDFKRLVAPSPVRAVSKQTESNNL